MKYCGKTHTGYKRELNEDAIFFTNEAIGGLPNLAIIADGMGGHHAGEVASQLAIDSFVSYCQKSENKNIEYVLKQATQYANARIYERALEEDNLLGMGTTLVACVLSPSGRLYSVNVGDSRLYVWNQQLLQLTIDHSWVEEMVRSGQITREESYHHPDKHKITRALGTETTVQVDFFTETLESGTNVLLCSDGLTNMVSDSEINDIFKSFKESEDCLEALLSKALQNGGMDNITLIIMDDSN